MKQIQPVFLAMKFSFLIFFFFSLPVGAQSIFQKYGRFLTEPRSYIIRKSKFPQNPKRSVRFSGKRTKRSVQKRKARNTQKAETKVL